MYYNPESFFRLLKKKHLIKNSPDEAAAKWQHMEEELNILKERAFLKRKGLFGDI